MKILVVSDTHRDFDSLYNLILNTPEAQAVIHLGDGEEELFKVRELFNGYLEITEENQLPNDLNEAINERLNHMPELQIGKYGQIQEWSEDYDEVEPGHRHISQLFALYPAGQIRMDKTPELAQAAKQTIERRL